MFGLSTCDLIRQTTQFSHVMKAIFKTFFKSRYYTNAECKKQVKHRYLCLSRLKKKRFTKNSPDCTSV